MWRFTRGRTLSEEAEHRAQTLVAVSFFIRGPYIAVEASPALIDADQSETMPPLGIATKRLDTRLGSAATVALGLAAAAVWEEVESWRGEDE